MKQEYTRGEIADLLAALRQVFSTVRLADAASGAVLDEAGQPAGEYCQVPPLDEAGRGWLLSGEDQKTLTLYRTARVEGRACLLLLDCTLSDTLSTEKREANAQRRQIGRASCRERV